MAVNPNCVGTIPKTRWWPKRVRFIAQVIFCQRINLQDNRKTNSTFHFRVSRLYKKVLSNEVKHEKTFSFYSVFDIQTGNMQLYRVNPFCKNLDIQKSNVQFFFISCKQNSWHLIIFAKKPRTSRPPSCFRDGGNQTLDYHR